MFSAPSPKVYEIQEISKNVCNRKGPPVYLKVFIKDLGKNWQESLLKATFLSSISQAHKYETTKNCSHDKKVSYP